MDGKEHLGRLFFERVREEARGRGDVGTHALISLSGATT